MPTSPSSNNSSLPNYVAGLFSIGRNRVASYVVIFTVLGIIVVSGLYLNNAGVDNKGATAEKIFIALIPMFGTWMGTVLAFYFGKENFQAAGQYAERVFTNLTPDLLDDVRAEQVMITKATMVYKELADILATPITELEKFLEVDVKKSRLPILSKGKAKYVVHSATFLKAISGLNEANETGQSFESFAKKYGEIITQFITAAPTDKLETIRKRMKDGGSIKDVFIVDDSGMVIGWITDTLVLNYMGRR